MYMPERHLRYIRSSRRCHEDVIYPYIYSDQAARMVVYRYSVPAIALGDRATTCIRHFLHAITRKCLESLPGALPRKNNHSI